MQKSALAAEDTGHRAALVLCKKIHAPIRRLSFDVLSEIAWHSIPSQPIGPSKSPRKSKKSKRFPFVFTHVCSAWRAAALSSPRIWTTLHLTISGMHSSILMNKLTQITEEWFKRARQLPLSLFIYIDDSFYNFERFMMFHTRDETRLDSPLGRFLTSLSPFIPRFQKLSITSQQRECLCAILEHPLTWDLRNLQSLYVRSSSYQYDRFSDENSPDRTNNHLFMATPALTHLNLDRMVAKHAELKKSLPWSQWTHSVMSQPFGLPILG